MISFHAAPSPDPRSKMNVSETPRKRKWGEGERSMAGESSKHKWHGSGEPGPSALDMELHLEQLSGQAVLMCSRERFVSTMTPGRTRVHARVVRSSRHPILR
ncbi:hypothetical protein MLD38_024653 [Melastoma candidum]|uniref:Uncharacterized protein n=1 Tax=Melastoma candidum TaxID=119954 RepID=A0ACB9NWE1_9MYRT|nr:hypothetical protein MLD38_024653 [Melastoma candidum]